ncbi:MAG: carboxymuconolactone decarboxylase family protein [Hyphomonas sp.]|nr:carboxymuconolactone decarboxylase family protein [Hyphomonas sp.]
MAKTLAPLPEPWPEDIAAMLARYPTSDGYILSLFRTFAQSKRFLQKGVPNLLDRESPLPLRVREIVILRVTANFGCGYEWGVHVAIFAKAAKFTEAQVAGTVQPGGEAPLWAPEEARLIAAVDRLCTRGALDAELKAAFEADWTTEQQLEILALCGAYHTVSLVANLAGLPHEDFVPADIRAMAPVPA